MKLEFLAEVEDLECSLICLEGDDLPLPVHDGTVGLDWPSCNLIVVLEIDNDDLRVGILGQLLADADIMIGLKGLVSGLAIRNDPARKGRYARMS